MLRRFRSHLTYANVMVTILAFIVLGGIGYAAATINGKDIKKHSEPGNRLKNHTVTAKQVKAPRLHLVGNPGEPVFQNNCANKNDPRATPVGFFKDDQGVVHLQGIYVCNTSGVVAFQLPRGYRPPTGKTMYFPLANGGGAAIVAVNGPGITGQPAGGVSCNGAGNCFLDGISFRAAR